MRLIDADVMRDEWLYESGTFEPNDVLDSIDCQPTIDAVEVVRCQKCKYYCGEETYTNHRICKIWNEETFANGWCYMGERKEQNDE